MLGGKNGPVERRHSHKFAAMGQDPALRIHIKKSPGKMLIPEIVPPSHSDGLLFTQCSPHSQHRAALGGIGRAALPASSSDQYGVSPMTKKERLWHTYLNMIKITPPVDPKQLSISIAAPACMSVVLVAPGVGNV